MKLCLLAAIASFTASSGAAAPVLVPPAQLGTEVQPFVHVPAGRTAITHLRIIDGTGATPIENVTLLLDGAKIAAVQGADVSIPNGYHVIDGSGETAMPGIVGMHNHMFYIARPNLNSSGHSDEPLVVPQMTFSAPRTLFSERRDDDADDGQRRALRGPQRQARDRHWGDGRAAHGRDGPVPRGLGKLLYSDAPNHVVRRCPANGRILGG